MSNKIRIGFVGVGNMGQMAHLRNYATIDDVRSGGDCRAAREDSARRGRALWRASGLPRPHRHAGEREIWTASFARSPLPGMVC